jgi:hypothetical protein
MLDDVERRRFLVNPAGEHPFPALVGLVDVELDEGSRQLLLFPRRGLLARAQADDRVLPADRLAGPKGHVLDDPVALVENSQHRDPLRHRSHAALPGRGHGHVCVRRGRRIPLLRTLAAAGKRKPDQQRYGEPGHAYSGIQGS